MNKVILLLAATAFATATSCAHKPASPTTEPTTRQEVKTTDKSSVPSTVKTIPANIKGTDVIKTIAANYKGKVVLIDLWATWCPPCRAAMKQIDTIKDDLAKKGCTFVYITGETSPLKDWNAMIPQIGGDHYRLTDAQWNEMCASLNVPGIPAYLLLGKDGNKVYDNLNEGGYPGNDVIQNNVEVALTK